MQRSTQHAHISLAVFAFFIGNTNFVWLAKFNKLRKLMKTFIAS
jgi:hypothetical protein